MSLKPRRPDRPIASIEELIIAVRRESAAALSTAEEFLPKQPLEQRVKLPQRFPTAGRPPEDPAQGPRDESAKPPHPDGRR